MQTAMDAHERGEWQASNAAIERAFRLVANQPEIKLGSTVGALLLTESLQDYKGDPHELVLLHTLGMLNYSFLGQWEEALVEARSADSLIAALEASGQPHADDPLSRYFSAKLFEGRGQWDDAYIDMVRARQAFRDLAPISKLPEPSFLAGDLLHVAQKAGRQDELRLLQKEYPGQSGELKAGDGEVWILVFDGSALQKDPKGGQIVPAQKILAGIDGPARTALERVYSPSLMSQAASKDKSLGEGLRSFTRFSFRLSLVAGLAVLTQGKGMDHAVEFLFSDPGQVKHWDNVPAQVYACRLAAPAGPRQLWLRGQAPGGHEWLEKVGIQIPAGGSGFLQLRIKDQARSLALSPTLRP